MKIIDLTPDYDLALAELIRNNLKKYKLDIPGTVYFDDNLNHLSDFYLAEPEKRHYFLMTDDDNKLVGGIGLAEVSFFDECCELQKLYLSDEVKGLGHSYTLMSLVDNKAKELGYKRIYLETHDNLAAAIHLYEKCGFLEIEKPEYVVHSTMNRFFMKDLLDYSGYWEKCWHEENPEELYGYLECWNRHSDTEMEVFAQHGIKSICDAACGFGAHTLALASNGFEVSAFDISEKAVELTRSGLKKYGYDDIEVKIASITSTGYDDDSFDAVTAYSVMDHLTQADAKTALKELMRIIKPGGLLLLSFDTAEEEDFLCEHDTLSDGSMVYTDNSSRSGMLYLPYDSDRIQQLIDRYDLLKQWSNKKGNQLVILQKK